MEKYKFTDSELRIIEMQPTPLAVYQSIDSHVHTLALSDGYLELFGFTDRADAYRLSNQNALCNVHPDDLARVGAAVRRFAQEDMPFEVSFRAKRYEGRGETCRIVHGFGRHIYTGSGARLAYVWFTDEGAYTGDDDIRAAKVEENEGGRGIAGLDDVDRQVRPAETDRQKEVYDQITGSLIQQYDTLYYIDIESSTYREIASTDEYKRLNVPATGNDFFAESRRSIRKYVHPEDQDKVMRLHYKDVLSSYCTGSIANS